MKTMNNVMGIEMLTEADWQNVRERIDKGWFCACMADDWRAEEREKNYLRAEWEAGKAIALEKGWVVEPLKTIEGTLR